MSSVQDDVAAMRQDVADLQRAHEGYTHGAAADAADLRAPAPVLTDERRSSAPWSITRQQEAQLVDGMGQAANMSQRATEDGILELRAHLSRLSSGVPDVQRLQPEDRLHSM